MSEERIGMTADGARPYHHGNLRAALVEAALEMVRTDGPERLSLREAARAAGVSPSAVYRHFGDRAALLQTVGLVIQERMAVTMREHMVAPQGADPRQRALQGLRGVGLGYVGFAVAEPGWFDAAFFGAAHPTGQTLAQPPEEGATLQVPAPFHLLTQALDDLVAAGGLSAERRPGAEFSCWSAVHGCAQLLLRGPLRDAGRSVQRAVTERVIDDIMAGIR